MCLYNTLQKMVRRSLHIHMHLGPGAVGAWLDPRRDSACNITGNKQPNPSGIGTQLRLAPGTADVFSRVIASRSTMIRNLPRPIL